MKKILILVIYSCLLFSVAALLVSCGEVSSSQNSQPPENNHSQPETDAVDTIQFKLKDGTNTFAIEPILGGAKFLDATEKEIARFTIGSDTKSGLYKQLKHQPLFNQ